jgi:hypothetical protein
MGQVRETIEISASPEDVWALAGDPGRIGDWVPSLAESRLEDDHRACTTQEGGEIAERILERSDEGRYYVYEITDSPLPLRSYRSRLAVHGHGDHSHVNWEAEFEAESPDLEPDLAGNFSQIYREGLATLRDRLESPRPD